MTVFRGFMKNAFREKAVIILYLLIFLLLGTLMVYAAEEEDKKNTEKLPITVIDRDGSALSKGLTTFLEETENVFPIKDDAKALREALYYEKTSFILFIPKGFEDQLKKGHIFLKGTGGENSKAGYYVEAVVGSYLHGIETFLCSGYTDREATTEMALIEKTFSSSKRVEEKICKSAGILKFFPFVFTALSCYVYGFVLLKYKDKNILIRHRASPVREEKRKVTLLIALITLAIVFWGILILVTWGLSGGEFFEEKNLRYFLINMAAMDVAGMSIAIFVLSLTRTRNGINALSNTFALGMSFVCGIFIPDEFLSPGIKKFSKLLPAYWYGLSNAELGKYGCSVDVNAFEKRCLYQMLFAAVMLVMAFIIAKAKDRE